jgi:uncharacterized NAD-dependent epimerase/dehydratase family protein
MPESHQGNAVVYCQGALGTTTGKTAHGLIRRSGRYHIVAVIDSSNAGQDAGTVLDGRANGIPVVPDLAAAITIGEAKQHRLTHFVIGLAPDGGRLDHDGREAVKAAIQQQLHIVAGLHDFLSDDGELQSMAQANDVTLHDVRKPPPRDQLHFYSGKIHEVKSLKIAVLGTDSAVGKRTTAWLLTDGLSAAGLVTEMVGTGQTAWLQGARFGITLDSLVNDFVAGELEHAVWSAWQSTHCDAIVIEGQGSLMHPAYPGGFEILAACRPDAVIMQHAPARREYDGFPGVPIAPLDKQIQAVELISDRPVVGITINHEGLQRAEIDSACATIQSSTGRPTCDPLVHGPGPIVDAILQLRRAQR